MDRNPQNSFQDMILALHDFWSAQGCLILLLSHEPAVMPEERIFEMLLDWLHVDTDERQPLFSSLLD